MRRTRVLALVLLGACLIAWHGAVSAQEESGVVEPRPSDSSMTTSITGTLVSRSGDSFVVEKDSGARLTFTLDESAVIPDRIGTGDRVTVAFDTLDGREYHAVDVQAETEPASTGSRDAAAPPDGGASQPASGETAPTPDESMPGTASPLPLLVLIGAITTGAAVALRAFRRRVV